MYFKSYYIVTHLHKFHYRLFSLGPLFHIVYLQDSLHQIEKIIAMTYKVLPRTLIAVLLLNQMNSLLI